MSFSKLYKKPLQPGDKIKLIGKDLNPHWLGIVEFQHDHQIKMIKPDHTNSIIFPGMISYWDYSLDGEGIIWIRYNDKPKKNYHPDWF